MRANAILLAVVALLAAALIGYVAGRASLEARDAASPTPTLAQTSPTATATAPATSTPTATATPAPTPTATNTAAPAALTSVRGDITVDQPRGFARVSSPIAISGNASVFEGALLWRVVDLAGQQLANGTAQTSAGAPARGTFSVSATVNVTRETLGYVEVWSTSPRDGSTDEFLRVPIVIAPRP